MEDRYRERVSEMIDNWFKYEENVKDDSHDRTRSDNDKQGSGAGGGFFNKPHLHIESITYSEAQIEIGRSYNNDYTVLEPQKFDSRLWIIKIHSRNPAFSILRNCIADAYITTAEGQSTSYAVNMPWKNLRNAPTMFAPYTSLSNPSRYEYKRIFAYYYVEELRQNYSSGRIDIRKNVGNDLYFMLTFKDSPYAYFLTKAGSEISHDKMDVFYYSIDGLSLALPLGNQYAFDILFSGVNMNNEYQGGHVKILVEIQSWDKMLLIH